MFAMTVAEANQSRVLVVDDEPMVLEVVTSYLERDGFQVVTASNGAEALQALEEAKPDLLVLDVMLPEIDGFDLLARIRRDSDMPVILLTARTEEPDRVLGLELGADDYVVKPFSPRELAARVRTVLRRSQPKRGETPLDFGELKIDSVTREVVLDGEVVPTTPKEFDLIAYLAASPRQVFSRSQLLEHVWDSSADYQDPSTVTVHIRRLRQKLEVDAENPRWLQTVWGVGYRFEP